MTIDQTQRTTGISPAPGASDTGEMPVVRIARMEPDPSTQPDALAAAVLNSLTRPIYFPLSWGVLPSFLSTLLTLGILPVLLIPRWLKGVIAQHEQQLWHLAEWLRPHTSDPLANESQKVSKQIYFRRPLAILAYLFAGSAVASILVHFITTPSNQWNLYLFAFSIPRSPAAAVFHGSMIFAALCNLVHVSIHQRNIKRYLTLFNELANGQSLQPVPIPRHEIGFSPLWVLAGLAICAHGALWPLPVMLMMGAHRGYTMGTSIRIRAQLADRMRSILKAQQPPIDVPEKPMTILRLCTRRNCRSSLNFESTFCPRCGTRVA